MIIMQLTYVMFIAVNATMPTRKQKIIKLAAPVFKTMPVDLVYVNNSTRGMRRVKRGKGWSFYDAQNKLIRDPETLRRIKSLVLPPAWKNVWICPDENGHLQATGIDAMGRKQYKYHPAWVTKRNETKFGRMFQFGQFLPKVREQVDKDLRTHELTESKVIALVIHLMDKTAIRIGNSSYEKMYGSYGLTTLRDKHVRINGSKIKIQFTGKKGIQQDLEVSNARLARLIKKCRDIPGQELFQYFDDNGGRKKIDSGLVNQYIKNVTGESFTAKDFRTWKASVFAIRSFMDFSISAEKTNTKQNVLECMDYVAKKLGNTRNVCKKYYIHPSVISCFERGTFSEIMELDNRTAEEDKYFRTGEMLFLHLLEAEQPGTLRKKAR